MLLISHRGNTVGPNKQDENKPGYLESAVCAGFNIEFDIRVINNQIFLGHDQPQYQITEEWLLKYLKVSWAHCKNYEALVFFTQFKNSINYFWHENDRYTLVSNGKVWIYPGQEYIPGGIIVLPELFSDVSDTFFEKNIYAVCSDYIDTIRLKVEN